ncbi:hypothetical protein chiPu_0008947 [Chiloscyllium punctatum]|uniref:Uncharacterized protein n=1 Tax=Chiloscyllium punctatum TaxID=137246 RepID=A0A401SJA1_CHIPU|nr:hypothetical protein [Chiloscyllium punctatum]
MGGPGCTRTLLGISVCATNPPPVESTHWGRALAHGSFIARAANSRDMDRRLLQSGTRSQLQNCRINFATVSLLEIRERGSGAAQLPVTVRGSSFCPQLSSSVYDGVKMKSSEVLGSPRNCVIF